MLAITLGVSICTFSCVFLALVGLAPHLQLLSSMTVPRMHVVAALAGTMMIARSPATAVRHASILRTCAPSELAACWG